MLGNNSTTKASLRHLSFGEGIVVAASYLILGGINADHRQDYPSAIAHLSEAASLLRRVGDEATLGAALFALGRLQATTGAAGDAVAHLQESLDLLRKTGNTEALAETLFVLGSIEDALDRDQAAVMHLEEAIGLLRQQGKHEPLARALLIVGRARIAQEDMEGARPYLQEALPLARRSGDERFLMEMLSNAVLIEGDMDKTFEYSAELLALAQRFDSPADVYGSTGTMGLIAQKRGDYQQAQQYYEEALQAAIRWDNQEAASWVRQLMSDLDRERQGRGLTALDLLKTLAELPGDNQRHLQTLYELAKADDEGPEAVAEFVDGNTERLNEKFFEVMEQVAQVGNQAQGEPNKALGRHLTWLAQQIKELVALRDQLQSEPASPEDILRMEAELVRGGHLTFGPYTLLTALMNAPTLLARWQLLLDNADKFDEPSFISLITQQRRETESRLCEWGLSEQEREKALQIKAAMEDLIEDMNFIRNEVAQGKTIKTILAQKKAEFEAARKLIREVARDGRSNFEWEKLVLDHYRQFDRTYHLVLNELIQQALDKRDRNLAHRYSVMAGQAVRRLFFTGPFSPELRDRWEKLIGETDKRSHA